MTLAVILAYLLLVLAVGAASHRLLERTGEGYFVADRSLGPFVLLMALFGTHMTSFALLGSSAQSYRVGIGVFALMASSSALVVPVVFFFVGARVWEVGKRHGFLTQVQYFRERWQSEALAVSLFVVLVLLLVPYLLIGILGGGVTLHQITAGAVPEWAGALGVCLVVLSYVCLGGMRGTAWVNTLQTGVFMVLGAITVAVVLNRLGGLEAALGRVSTERPDLLVREGHVGRLELLTYTFVPLSVGMFPHIFGQWLSARSARSFGVPVIFYPLCLAVVWVPSVLLGVLGAVEVPGLEGPAVNSILVRMIDLHAPDVLSGLLAAGVLAAIMSSLDSQSLSLGTMFTQDILQRYVYRGSLGNEAQVRAGRIFIVSVVLLTFLLSLVSGPSIFGLSIWSFTGFAGLFPIVVAALYWRRSTAVGALASVATVAVLWLGFFTRGWGSAGYSVAGTGIMPVAVIVPASAAALIVGSLLSAPPGEDQVAAFFPEKTQ
jgi:SSS family solute:Na+ symporter